MTLVVEGGNPSIWVPNVEHGNSGMGNVRPVPSDFMEALYE